MDRRYSRPRSGIPAFIAMIFLPSLVDAECVYKAVMTADDLRACQEADAPKPTAKQTPATPPKQWTAEDQAKFAAAQAQERQRLYEKQQAKQQEESRQERPTIGMTVEQAKQTRRFATWCSSPKINRTTSARGIHEQWVCLGDYYYFDNGVLTTVQEHGR